MATVFAALLTPFRDDESIAYDAVAAHVDFLACAGVDGVVTGGTTGEGPLLDDDELIRLADVVVASARGRLAVVAHVGRPSTRATAALAARAVEAAVDGLMAVTPYYVDCDDEALMRHYAAVAAAAPDAPLLVYTIPPRTRTDVAPTLVPRLATVGVAGLKDSTKDFDRHREYLAVSPAGFDVYMGSDEFALKALSAGATGLMSALANIRPELVCRLRDAVAAGELDAATSAQAELAALRDGGGRGKLARLKTAVAAATGTSYPAVVRAPGT